MSSRRPQISPPRRPRPSSKLSLSKRSHHSSSGNIYWCDPERTSNCEKCTRSPLKKKNQCHAICTSTGKRCNRPVWNRPGLKGESKWCKQHSTSCSKYMFNYKEYCSDNLKRDYAWLPEELSNLYFLDEAGKSHKNDKTFKDFYGFFINMPVLKKMIWISTLVWAQPEFYDPENPESRVNTTKSRTKYLNNLLKYAEGCVDRKRLSNKMCFIGKAYKPKHERYTLALWHASGALRTAFKRSFTLNSPLDDLGKKIL